MKEVPPTHPLQELSHKIIKKKTSKIQIDSRREHNARFCCRERVGTAKTPSTKRVVYNREGRPMVARFFKKSV